MLSNQEITIYDNLKKQFHGQLIICGSTAMFYHGMIPAPPKNDFDLILLHRNNSPSEIEEDLKKLELLCMTNQNKAYPPRNQEEEKIGLRFFLIFNQGKREEKSEPFNVDIFVSKSLLHDGVSIAHYPGMEIFLCSPMNVILAKKSFNRPKDISALCEIAKAIMP